MRESSAVQEFGERMASEAHPAFLLATQLPKAQEVPMPELVSVWTDEWTDEDEYWGVALNGTGQYRRWHGALYTARTDQTVAIEHPAGTAVVGIDGQAIAVAKPDGIELFCDRDATKIWEHAVLRALHDRLVALGMDIPPFAESVSETEGGGPRA